MRVNLEARAATAENRRAKTRERLLDAATEVISRKGPEAASIEDFVAAAGVSRGTFYNYFPAIGDLIIALNARVSSAMVQALEPVPPHQDIAVRFATVLHHILATFTADPVQGWMALRLSESDAPTDSAFAAQFDILFLRGVEQGRFSEAADVVAARNIVVGAFRMAQRDIFRGDAPPEHGTHVVALLLVACGLREDEAHQISRECAEAARRAPA
ncbi:TetR/AcrR family transcriptional regulator [Phenylobacterium sp. LH3H17]|uniref:TetR/AcrR family transcriptional regulator n=1 Tax=Phenylobacterium sp. LH3H17 TaxID=2903901 RepID=UPI0020CA12C3|nr:TetR/AcrR family transcriptional regulator [Phenylobacterium sp. LH3H17]UTP39496.1 TetR/AcrR family transcriptional regulator [Phenylobacterium sp. LH3H17]